MRDTAARRLAWSIWGVTLAQLLLLGVLIYLNRSTLSADNGDQVLLPALFLSILAYATVGDLAPCGGPEGDRRAGPGRVARLALAQAPAPMTAARLRAGRMAERTKATVLKTVSRALCAPVRPDSTPGRSVQ